MSWAPVEPVAIPKGAVELHAHGLHLVLLAGCAVWWPKARMLFVADVHFGKAASFRRAGQPVPRGTTADNLARLSQLLGETASKHLVFLGDLVHAKSGADTVLWATLEAWLACHAGLDWTLVRGNHDLHAGDPPAALRMQLVSEPWTPLPGEPLVACHHPQRVPGTLALAGHWHPTARVFGSARDRLRLPCFALWTRRLVLPAFGAFTGTAPMRWPPEAQLFVVAGDRVLQLPR
ncbi:MAG: ligase-associated DNA damage response endonuclease PdeM [Burkholderiaceae bacterium]|jgi:DNA ligase-associated metallophosphoesterase|nr:ligase-associated DNA damage response endonuclease PdeM [Burkholderiaceae bacterium]